jgi:phenylalanyl-tRNA synthetase beta chain
MKIPLSWLKEFVSLPAKVSAEDIAQAFVNVGFEIEGIDYQGKDLKGPLLVGKVLSIEELSGHKKPIRYVGLDLGSGKTRFVICGARNFKVNDLVVVAVPGAVLPGNFAIAARETYGKVSDGMICSAKELGISDEHAGIIVLPEGKVGSDAIKLLEIEDVIFDVAINPDRGYAMSVRGLARELSASLKCKFTDPASNVQVKKLNAIKSPKAIGVKIEDKTGADQIFIRTLDQVNTKISSPIWMQRRLEKCGMRSISLAVDITNYVMLELGQPLHAFDADVITGGLRVARANKFSKLVTLDKVERKLSADNLLICDTNSALALAGTMGGLASEVTSQTTKIALEAAHFDPISIARNSRFHKLSSEASRRMERNTDPALTEIASARAAQLLIDLAGAKYLGSSFAGLAIKPRKIKISVEKVCELVGAKYTLKQVKDALILIGCKVTGSGSIITIEVPTWRPDLSSTADFAEEIARLVGYDQIPLRLPIGKSGAKLSTMQNRKRQIALMLANQGYTEVINYPFVNQELVDALGFTGDRAKSFKLANPMSEDFPLLRTHLLPGLLTTLSRNINRGAKDLALFEIGSVFRNISPLGKVVLPTTERKPSQKVIDSIYSSVPNQMLFVAGVSCGEKYLSSWQGEGSRFEWSDAVSKAAEIIESTGNKYEITGTDLAPWHPGRCAEFKVAGKVVAHAGELHPRVIATLNLPARTCAFAVILNELPEAKFGSAPKIWNMPAAVQDIALVVSKNVSASDVEDSLRMGAGELLESISLFDRYDQIGDEKVSLAFTLTFRAADRTLTAEEVSGYRDEAVKRAGKDCGAVLRS